MSGTVSQTAAYVDSTGIHAPSYQDLVGFLTSQFQAIYGADIVVSPDSQDGQLIGIFALALSDLNAACIAVYNSFSPSTAQGVGLSSNVKINGMTRAIPSQSTVQLLVTGVAYTVINNGVARDDAGNSWALPSAVEIDATGQITVTGTCTVPGAVFALPNTITEIATVTLGWQSVTNPAAADLGAPLETDAALRQRQATSTAVPSVTVLSGIVGAVLKLSGVTSCVPYENDTNTDYTTAPITTTTTALVASGATVIPVTSVAGMAAGQPIAAAGIPANTTISSIAALNVTISHATTASIASGATITVTGPGTPPIGEGPLPPHSISLVVQGGDPVAICNTILMHKTPGCYTYGTTRRTVDDGYGLPHDIGFYIPTPVNVGVSINLKAGAGYSSIIGSQISAAVASYINALGSGEPVVWSKLWLPANLCDWTTGVPTNATGTYDITQIIQGTPPSGTAVGYAMTNIPISIFQIAQCQVSDVIVHAS
jgi:uncharacterized phage protein gp47/JayE